MDIPPLPSETPPSIPPPPVAPPPLEPKRPSRLFLVAVAVVGTVQLLLSIYVADFQPGAESLSYRIGNVIGATAVWPLIMIGLFSIARRFRNSRSHAVILLVVWGLSILAQLGNISAHVRLASRPPAASGATDEPERPARPTEPQNSSAAPPVTATESMATPAYDFSPGSDQRLIQLIEHSQEERYHAVAAAYVQACATRPTDAVLALERVKFIERFADAEDINIESTAADHKAALEYLNGSFPTAPGTVLYQLGSANGFEFEAKANRYAPLVPTWSAPDRAQYFLLLANAADGKGGAAKARPLATTSFQAEPTVAAGLLIAKAAYEAKDYLECRRVLGHEVFTSAQPWMKKQKMELLFDIKQTADAIALYEEVKTAAPLLVCDAPTAMRLARSGKVAAARSIFEELPPNDWNKEAMSRQRLAFELEFGTADQAGRAYRALRETGIQSDPVLRDRLALFRKHPGFGWNLDDLIGAVLLGLLIMAAALAPLLLLSPVHYWSLLRARLGKSGGWPEARWGLREAWMALGVMLVAELLAIWGVQPELMRTWWGKSGIEAPVETSSLVLQQAFGWLALAATLILLVSRARAWRLLGPGNWGIGKAIGVAVGAALLLRLSLGAYARIWPGAVFDDPASLSPQTQALCLELIKIYGPWGLVAVMAGFVPVLEELLFRGVLLQALAKHIPFGWANSGQALVFGLVHENYRLLPFFFAFGLVAGMLARRSAGLFPSIVFHSCNNLLACLALILTHRTLQ